MASWRRKWLTENIRNEIDDGRSPHNYFRPTQRPLKLWKTNSLSKQSLEKRTKEMLSLHLDLSQENQSRLQKNLIVSSASCLYFVKSTTTSPPPTQVMNSDNGLILAFNNSPTKMTSDKSMPLDRIISTTCSGSYNSAYNAVLEASFFLLSLLIFSSFFL